MNPLLLRGRGGGGRLRVQIDARESGVEGEGGHAARGARVVLPEGARRLVIELGVGRIRKVREEAGGRPLVSRHPDRHLEEEGGEAEHRSAHDLEGGAVVHADGGVGVVDRPSLREGGEAGLRRRREGDLARGALRSEGGCHGLGEVGRVVHRVRHEVGADSAASAAVGDEDAGGGHSAEDESLAARLGAALGQPIHQTLQRSHTQRRQA